MMRRKLILAATLPLLFTSCATRSNESPSLSSIKTDPINTPSALATVKILSACEMNIKGVCYVSAQKKPLKFVINAPRNSVTKVAYVNNSLLTPLKSSRNEVTDITKTSTTVAFHITDAMREKKTPTPITFITTLTDQSNVKKTVRVELLTKKKLKSLCQSDDIRCVNQTNPTFSIRIWPFNDGGYTTQLGTFDNNLITEEKFKHIPAKSMPPGMVGAPDQFPSIKYTFKATKAMLNAMKTTTLTIESFRGWDKKNTLQTSTITIYPINEE